MKKEESYKYSVNYRVWDGDYREQQFKTMLGAKAFFDFVAGDPSVASAFLWDNETVEIVKRSVK